MNEKKWFIDYTVIYKDGQEREERITLYARTLDGAIKKTYEVIRTIREDDPTVDRVAPWSVCIGAEEVI